MKTLHEIDASITSPTAAATPRKPCEWYRKHLGMDFVLAIAEDQVPSTNAPDPYMHLFLDAGSGNVLAFFELPNSPPMGRDAQHARLGAAHRLQGRQRRRRCEQTKARLEAAGIAVVGVDRPHHLQVDLLLRPQRPPPGAGRRHRARPRCTQKLDEVKWEMLEEWARTKRAPKHAPGCTRANSRD